MPAADILPKVDNQSRFDGGISDYDKDSAVNEVAFLRSLNYRDDPRQLTLLSKTVKESGSVVLGLPKDGDKVGTDIWYVDDGGRIYKRTSAGSHSLLRSVASSHGNGIKYYSEDDFVYYTGDTVIGRYGMVNGTSPTFVDDFLGSEGGVPTNTHALDLESGSTQYASRADTASLSITGDLAIEASIKPESLPTAGNSMVIFSKWDINSNKRSYKFEIYAASGYFGDGSDGALTISSDTTEAPIDSACTGTSGTKSLSATNVSFAAGQKVLIHQTQGTGAGTKQENKIASYTAGTITLEDNLNADYTTGAQVRVVKQYTDVTIQSGKTYSAKAWNGTVGGILAFLANGTITATGIISASGNAGTAGSGGGAGGTGKGFRGGAGAAAAVTATQGEGLTGTGTTSYAANGIGGGGGSTAAGAPTLASGGGGGYGTAGTSGTASAGGNPGAGGSTSGSADLTTMQLGGGGGGSAGRNGSGGLITGGGGGGGGGIIFIAGTTVTVTGSITASGGAGGVDANGYAGGGGAGGSVLIKAQTATLGTGLVTAAGGDSTAGDGDGGSGRIHLDYYTSYTGTTSPTLDVIQDNTLLANTTYQLRLGISSNGTAEEYMQKNSTLVTGTYFHVGVSWDASDHEAEFMQDGVSLGTSAGAATAIHDNASVATIGADFNNTTPRSLYDGKIDEVRVWSVERTAAQMLANKGIEIAVNTPGLAAYYKLNNSYDDATANANHLTASGSPVFTTDVPFSSPTGRLDLDQSLDTTGQLYTLAVAISETAANKQTFVPQKDPQKSIEVLVDTVGTGAWTLTVHDAANRTIATKTIANASMHTGDVEFTFATAWTPVKGATYHFHLTSTVADGKVATTTADDMETVDFHTYYQFMVTDSDYHPIEQMLNFLAIGNGRYLAKYSASGGYDPHRLEFPAGWKVRCFAKWRDYLAIGCWKGTNMYDTDQGIIFFWDGYSKTYNFYIEVPEGGINAMLSSRGILWVWAGYHGDMIPYIGGDTADDTQLKRLPKMEATKYIETMPKAVAMWDGLLRWGAAGTSDSANVERGVYTYGKRKGSNKDSLSYDYPISTGNRATTNIKIGFLYPIGKKLLIGWKDNTAYGVDVVDPAASPFTTGEIVRNIKDYGGVWKRKKALTVRADFKTLLTGEQVRVKYKLDRASDWTYGSYTTSSSDDKTIARLPINLGNHKEVQIGADVEASGTTSPTFTELTLEEEMMPSDRMV